MVVLGRLFTAMVTPFSADDSVDYKNARRLASALVKSGSDGLVVSGTTGESPNLSTQEKIRLFSEIKDELGDTKSVIAGTGNYSTKESIELSTEAKKAGADALLLVVPYYNKPTQEGLYQHFKAIAESTDLPCILYNVPSRTITNLDAETTIRLSEISNIVGIKEASSDFDQISYIIDGTNEDFKIWSGNDSDTFSIMCLGGYGVISVASHLVGLQIKSMIQMLLDGSILGAASLHHKLLPISKGLFTIANPIPVKYCVNLIGFPAGHTRLPLTEVDSITKIFLDNLLSQYKIDLPV
jgi:4-hydroxy-tetrahydrodipicolinate synthase